MTRFQEQVEEDVIIARMRAIEQYYRDIQQSDYYPYCYIPDLFDTDPQAERPYSVPDSFIPEDVGGNIQIVEAESGEVLATETLNQMLGSFLPGGFKRRWKDFQINRLEDKPSNAASRRVNLEDAFNFEDALPLAELLGEDKQEQYTPFQHPTDDVSLYFPQEMFVRQLSDKPEFWWDDENCAIWTSEPKGISNANSYRLGRSDPTTNYLWFKHLNPDDLFAIETKDINDTTGGLANRVGFDEDIEVLRCYYASLLTLYEKDNNETFSRVIRYHHDKNDETVFVTSRERSQALFFNFARTELQNRIQDALDNTVLRRDIQFAMLYRQIWDRLFFESENGLEHVFAVEPFVDTLIAVDYWQRINQPGPDSLFDLSVPEITGMLETLLPDETVDGQRRLHLLGDGHSKREEYKNLLENTENRQRLAEIIETCADRTALLDYAETITLHTVTHGLSSWGTQEATGGASFEMWYDVNFQARERDYAKVAIYDSIQGGAGIGRELFDQLDDHQLATFDEDLKNQARCHTAAAEDVTIDLFADYDPRYLFEINNSSPDELRALAEEAYDGSLDADDVAAIVRRRVRSLFETPELARFYGAVADVIQTLEDDLARTPRTVDVLLRLEDYTFRDSRVETTYERFANRNSQRRDLSEVAERIGEITKQCIYACPDCLKTHSTECMHGMRYQEQMLNRQLLAAIMEG